MNMQLLLICCLAIFTEESSIRSQLFQQYSERPQLAVLVDSIQVQQRINRVIVPTQSRIQELTENLVNFLLLQRTLQIEDFFTTGGNYSLLGITYSFVAAEACDYLQEVLSDWYTNFNCSTTQLQHLSMIAHLRKVSGLAWNRAFEVRLRLTSGYECTYWNTRLAKNCTGLDQEIYSSGLQEIQRIVMRAYSEDCNNEFTIC